MASTYEPIATTTLGSISAQVTLSSIPSTYTDLILIQSGAFNPGTGDVYITLNNDGGGNYSNTWLSGTGTSALSGRESNQGRIICDIYAYPSTDVSTRIFQFMNYSNTTTNKTVLIRSTSGTTGTDAIVGLWRSTTAINRIDVYAGGAASRFAVATTFTLYGIKAA
jgi:hypothetical protein